MTTLICTSVDPFFEPITGSIIMLCDRCRREIWVSPASLLIATAEAESEMICFACVPQDADVELLPPTAGQMVELRQELERRKE